MNKDKPLAGCMNCGNSSHCNDVLYRKEIEIIGDKTVNEWTIDVCRHCRCEECKKDED